MASGHRIVPIFGLAEVDPEDPEGFVDIMLDAVYSHWSLPHTKTTVLQDWQKGRRGEADQLNGYVARQQQILGGNAPANELTAKIARLIESGELKAKPENAEILTALL